MAFLENCVKTVLNLCISSKYHKSAYSYFEKSSYLPNWCVMQGQTCYMAFDESTSNGQTVQIEKDKWILDSGCSRHMTGNPEILKDITYHDG